MAARSVVHSDALTYSTIPITSVTTGIDMVIKNKDKFTESSTTKPEDDSGETGGENIENLSVAATGSSSSSSDSAATETVESSCSSVEEEEEMRDGGNTDIAPHCDLDDQLAAGSSARNLRTEILGKQEQRTNEQLARNARLRSKILRKYDSNERILLHFLSSVIVVTVLSVLVYSFVAGPAKNVSISPRVVGWAFGFGVQLLLPLIGRLTIAALAVPSSEVKSSFSKRIEISIYLGLPDFVGQGPQMMCSCALLLNATMMLSSRVGSDESTWMLLVFGLLLGALAILLQVSYAFWKTSDRLITEASTLSTIRPQFVIAGILIILSPFVLPSFADYNRPDSISHGSLGAIFGFAAAGGLGWFATQRWIFARRRHGDPHGGAFQRVALVELETPQFETELLVQASRTLCEDRDNRTSDYQTLTASSFLNLQEDFTLASNTNRKQAYFLLMMSFIMVYLLFLFILLAFLLNLLTGSEPATWIVPSSLYSFACLVAYLVRFGMFRQTDVPLSELTSNNIRYQSLLLSEIASNRSRYLLMDIFSGISKCTCFTLMCLLLSASWYHEQAISMPIFDANNSTSSMETSKRELSTYPYFVRVSNTSILATARSFWTGKLQGEPTNPYEPSILQSFVLDNIVPPERDQTCDLSDPLGSTRTQRTQLLFLSSVLALQILSCETGLALLLTENFQRCLDGLLRQSQQGDLRLEPVIFFGLVASLSGITIGPAVFLKQFFRSSSDGRCNSILPAFFIACLPYGASCFSRFFFLFKYTRKERMVGSNPWLEIAALMGMRPIAPQLGGSPPPGLSS